ncbi:hypothetical protein F3Y22_tig00110893pilonHSYRG00781 [Hibiscus syriacus]|uniref:Reverse transcriptase Ty1/copia-type domain-containing protein n=1 Tax=Hibiscus syriacus TaxID=106335 RepID=A0A6A2ZHX7_HIBSY|nr:hypothetical protein F3Y22_tig00110893pilonHSYRG00781 [Hibiscus syriacus]
MMHVINLSTSVPLRGDVSDRVWFGNDVSYDHLPVFGCKAFFHNIPKDEISKLDAKTRQYIFIGYGLDGEFGYRLYDLVQKKLMRSRDIIFIEDQTIDDINKTEKVDSQDSGDFDAPMDDVANDQQQAPIALSTFPLRRSSRDRRSSVMYSSDEYVLLTDGGEPECYEEAMESECKDQWIEAMKDELQSLQENHTFELLVVKGYTQKEGIGFEEIFSSVMKMSSIRTILSLAACYDLEVEQMVVKTFFIHGEQGYKKTTYDHCVFVKRFSNDDFIILLLYVDDMLIVGRNASRIEKLKLKLRKSFAMKDLGLSVKHCPSIENEKEEIQKVPYSSVVDSLLYAIVCTRSDLAYVVGNVSQFLSNPGIEHWNVVKWIMIYLRGSSNLKLCFGNEKLVLVGYIDSDMAGDIGSMRSTSTIEACNEMLWMKKFVRELGFTKERYVLYCDSQTVIHLGKNSTFHARSNHIDVKYYWIRYVLEVKLLKLEKIHTDDNDTDMLTKVLPREKFEAYCLTVRMEVFPA